MTLVPQTGSHNLVLGGANSYSSYGGLVGGTGNSISNSFASVLGGSQNVASGSMSAILCGYANHAASELGRVSPRVSPTIGLGRSGWGPGGRGAAGAGGADLSAMPCQSTLVITSNKRKGPVRSGAPMSQVLRLHSAHAY
jgi:hypothetical protein